MAKTSISTMVMPGDIRRLPSSKELFVYQFGRSSIFYPLSSELFVLLFISFSADGPWCISFSNPGVRSGR